MRIEYFCNKCNKRTYFARIKKEEKQQTYRCEDCHEIVVLSDIELEVLELEEEMGEVVR